MLVNIVITVVVVMFLVLTPFLAHASVTTSMQIALPGFSTTAVVAVSPNGAYVAVSDPNTYQIALIDTSTNTVISSTPSQNTFAWDLAFSPDSSKLYMSGILDDTVLTLRVPDLAVLNTVTLPTGSSPGALAITASGSVLYVGSYTNAAHIYKIVTATGTTTDLGASSCDNLFEMVLTPAESFLYASCQFDNAVKMLSTGTGVVSQTITVGSSPRVLISDQSVNTIYVGNSASNSISVISTSTNALMGTISVGSEPRYIALSPDGSTLAVSRYYDRNVALYGTASLTLSQVLSNFGSNYGQGVAFAPNGAALWEALSNGQLTKWVVSPPLYTPPPIPAPTPTATAEPTLSATGLDATPYFLVSGALVGGGLITLAVSLVLRRRAPEKSE